MCGCCIALIVFMTFNTALNGAAILLWWKNPDPRNQYDEDIGPPRKPKNLDDKEPT